MLRSVGEVKVRKERVDILCILEAYMVEQVETLCIMDSYLAEKRLCVCLNTDMVSMRKYCGLWILFKQVEILWTMTT